jgi:hypothetical protein
VLWHLQDVPVCDELVFQYVDDVDDEALDEQNHGLCSNSNHLED